MSRGLGDVYKRQPRQEQTGPTIPESGDVVVSFDKINELMAEKRQNARAEVEKAETPEAPEAAAPGETPQPANTEEPKKPRRGRPPKAEKAATENQKVEKSAGARKGMYGFLMRVLLSTSTQSYAVPHKNYMIR